MRCGVCDENEVIPNEDGSIPDCRYCLLAINEIQPIVYDLGEIDYYVEEEEDVDIARSLWDYDGGDDYDQYDELGD